MPDWVDRIPAFGVMPSQESNCSISAMIGPKIEQ
jgi:hypothetical protein